MKFITRFLFVLLLTVLSSCWVKNLNSAFESKDLIFDDTLVGIWSVYSDDTAHVLEQKLIIEKKDSLAYNITMIYFLHSSSSIDSNGITTKQYGERDTISLEGHLGKIGNAFYLEMNMNKKSLPATAKLYYLTFNYFLYKINYTNKTLSLSHIQHEHFKEIAQKSKLSYHQAQDDEPILITAGTKQLKAFLKKYEKDKELFGDETIYSR